MYLYNGTIYLDTFHGGQRSLSTAKPTIGEWHHLVAQATAPDATSVVLDTLSSATSTGIGGAVLPTRSFNVGARDDGELPLGPGAKLAEIAFYDHVLSPERITAHYLAGKVP